MSDPIRIATRQSPLALWQANEVRDLILKSDSSLAVELVPMSTTGDRFLNTPLSKIGGKGLFVKELEAALFDGRADLAVHSMKDVTAVLPEGLMISTVLSREDPFDAFVSPEFQCLSDLPKDAIIGTCSPRRMSQLLAYNAKFRIHELRGNVNSRLAKLDAGDFDAIILACAGLKRLGFGERIREKLSSELCLPAVGQGIIGIEIREDDHRLKAILDPLHDTLTAQRLNAERALSASLNGGCSAPMAGFTEVESEQMTLRGRVISMDGATLLEASVCGSLSDGKSIGFAVADKLREQGAQAILDAATSANAVAGVTPD